MITTFHLPADELNLAIIKSIKEAFKGKNIEIIVSDTNEQVSKTSDLLARIENLRNDVNTVTFKPDEFFKTYKKKIANSIN